MSDLHLESQDFAFAIPEGDVLILAGDLCHAACLDPARKDLYAVRQRDRVSRFAETARSRFAHVLMVPGNHDHYDGVLEDTAAALARALAGFTVLDNASLDIGGVRFFGTTLWSDFEGRDAAAMERARRGCGEFFFVKTRVREDGATERLEKLRPHHTLARFDAALAALGQLAETGDGSKTVVVSHHAPSRKGLNPLHMGNGLDGAYASDLDPFVAALSRVPIWVHGHTHVVARYRIGETTVLANCRGFEGRDRGAGRFNPAAAFDLTP